MATDNHLSRSGGKHSEHPRRAKPAVLDQDYYLTNFRHLVEFVYSAYSDLLSTEELDFAQRLLSLEEGALRLYIRLLCRSKSVFRLDKLNYPEIGNLFTAAKLLQQAKLLQIDPALDVASALTLLTKPEVLKRSSEVMLSLGCNTNLKGLKRAALDEELVGFLPDAQLLTVGLCVLRTESEELFDVFKLCFFGNLYQDMTDYVLRDLGLTRFEQYRIDAATRAFSSRKEIESHLGYYQCSAQLDCVEPEDYAGMLAVCKRLPSVVLGTKSSPLQRRVDRLRNRVARDLERGKQWELAAQLFEQSHRPPARERRARILIQQEKFDDAFILCKEVLDDPFNEEELQVVSAFASRLAKKHGRSWPHVKAYQPIVEHLEIANNGEAVEVQCTAFYGVDGQCFFTENVLFNAVFGLAFWDIIFAPVQGAFFNPFQQAPADFYEPEFQRERSDLIKQRFKRLAGQHHLQELVLYNYQRCMGLQNPVVSWRYLKPELLELALLRIPIDDWHMIFKRQLKDLRLHRNGLPDLIHFPEAGGYRLIEVKGPGDTLQKNQIRWMEYFHQIGVSHFVSKVQWAESA